MSDKLRKGVCLELPLNVQNIDKAIKAVGGEKEIVRVTASSMFGKDREGLELRLRSDTFHHPITSMNVPVSNIIIEIKLPKQYFNGRDVKSALVSAKREGYRIEARPVLHVTSLHRFRGMADFQYYTGNSGFANKMRNSVFNANLPGLQTLRFNPVDVSAAEKKTDILPPPRFSLNTQPFYYGYKQSAYVKIVNNDQGETQLVHTVPSARVISNILNWGDAVPEGPPSGLEENPKTVIKDCVKELENLFNERPSYTRRTLQYKLGNVLSRQLKYALPYVAYYYRSGPWRSAYIRYGSNPHTDNSLAIYQVEHFRITSENRSAENTSKIPENYIFDGSAYPGVPMLQLCDIKDGVLEHYINTKDLRRNVDAADGWFEENTITIIRKVLRAELIALKEKESGGGLTLQSRSSILGEVVASLGQDASS